MASPAFELLSQQFMRRCSTAPSQLARRQASTSSSAQHKISEHLGRLQLDISQRRADRVWRGLRILRDLSPSSITAELLAASIPLLAGSYKSSLGKHVRHEEPADAARRAVRVQEEAETLYAKYRFVCTCLEQKALKPLNAKTVFGWAKAFEELGYAPAAWRLWNDRRKLADAAETQAAQAEDLGLLSHSVLIASIRYLRLREGSDSIEEIRKEVLDATTPIFDYLQESEQQDQTSRSLQIRIVRACCDILTAERTISQIFGFNFDFPAQSTCLPFVSTSSLSYAAPSGSKPWRTDKVEGTEDGETVMDRHTLNTILTMRGERKDLSKMMSTVEAALYPLSPLAFPLRQTADQNSFFSPSSVASFRHVSSASLESPVQDERTMEGDLLPAEKHYRPVLNLAAVNTHSFELLVETAINLGCTSLAIHYFRELVTAWQQERQRLRQAFAELMAWNPTAKRVPDNLPSLYELGKIPASRVGVTIHPISTIFNSLKYGRDESQRKYPYLATLVAESERVLALLQEDAAFWSQILEKKRILSRRQAKDMLYGDAAEVAEGRGVHREAYLSSETQLSLAKRNEVELDALLGRMHVKAADLLSQRRARVHIANLRRKDKLQWLPIHIELANRWIARDEALDEERLAAIQRMRVFSVAQRDERVISANKRFTRRRESVRQAVVAAQAAIAGQGQKSTMEVEQSLEGETNAHLAEKSTTSTSSAEQHFPISAAAAPGLAWS